MLVAYTGVDEVIVCDKKDEKNMLKEYFTDGGRSKDDYDREECKSPKVVVVKIEPKIFIDREECKSPKVVVVKIDPKTFIE
jgi:hypothetical protein